MLKVFRKKRKEISLKGVHFQLSTVAKSKGYIFKNPCLLEKRKIKRSSFGSNCTKNHPNWRYPHREIIKYCKSKKRVIRTRPLEKRERPRLTQDSAVWVLGSEEDWEVGEEEQETTKTRAFFWEFKRVAFLEKENHCLVFALAFGSERQRSCWFRAEAATAIQILRVPTLHQTKRFYLNTPIFFILSTTRTRCRWRRVLTDTLSFRISLQFLKTRVLKQNLQS